MCVTFTMVMRTLGDVRWGDKVRVICDPLRYGEVLLPRSTCYLLGPQEPWGWGGEGSGGAPRGSGLGLQGVLGLQQPRRSGAPVGASEPGAAAHPEMAAWGAVSSTHWPVLPPGLPPQLPRGCLGQLGPAHLSVRVPHEPTYSSFQVTPKEGGCPQGAWVTLEASAPHSPHPWSVVTSRKLSLSASWQSPPPALSRGIRTAFVREVMRLALPFV